MASLIILSFVEWSGAFQRPQHVAVEFARMGWDVTYLAPRFAHRLRKSAAPGIAIPSNLRVVTPWVLPGASRARVADWANRRLLSYAVPEPPAGRWDVAIFNDARLAEIAKDVNAGITVWDHMDDLAEHVADEQRLRKLEAASCDIADLIWTGSAGLAEQHATQGQGARFISGGVDAERFANPQAGDVEKAREELRPWIGDDAEEDAGPNVGQGTGANGPIRKLAVYFGAINERLDARPIEAVLDAGWKVLMIGPGSSRAPKLPNSRDLLWLGTRPYAALPAYLALAEVALVPYRIDGAHRFLYPVKILEYLAAGKPVLSSALPEVVRTFSESVFVRAAPSEWSDFLERWDEGESARRSKVAAGKKLAFGRSWTDVVREMADDLKELEGIEEKTEKK